MSFHERNQRVATAHILHKITMIPSHGLTCCPLISKTMTCFLRASPSDKAVATLEPGCITLKAPPASTESCTHGWVSSRLAGMRFLNTLKETPEKGATCSLPHVLAETHGQLANRRTYPWLCKTLMFMAPDYQVKESCQVTFTNKILGTLLWNLYGYILSWQFMRQLSGIIPHYRPGCGEPYSGGEQTG